LSQMMNCVVVLLALAVASAAPANQPRDLSNYTFDMYVKEFNKIYVSDVALQYHREVFNTNLEQIKQINAAYSSGEITFFAAVNKFADLKQDDMKRFKGLRRSTGSSALLSELPHINAADLPASIDWRTKGAVTAVKNQGGCGSCWTFSTAETLESHIAVKTGKLLTFSEQQIVSCAKNPSKCGGTGGCEGATQELAFNYTRDAGGISLESSYPYTGTDSPCDASKIKPVATIDGYVRLDSNNASQLMSALVTQGPIAISLAASGLSFQLYGGGILSGNLCGWDIDHAVQAVGYGVENNVGYWIVRNSWGPGWGESGYVRIYREIAPGKPEACGIDNSPGDGDGCPDGPKKITVCGECGILSDSSYPVGGRLL